MTQNHSTKIALIECAVRMIRDDGWQSVTSDRVLEVSGISKGSLYHHFEDFPDLIGVALVEIFSQMVENTLSQLESALTSAESKEDFLSKIRAVTHGNVGYEITASRLARIDAMAIGWNSPRMKSHIGEVQLRINRGLTAIFQEVVAKGWGNPHLDPEVVGIFVQSYNVGSVIGSLSTEKLDPTEWNYLVDGLLASVILNG